MNSGLADAGSSYWLSEHPPTAGVKDLCLPLVLVQGLRPGQVVTDGGGITRVLITPSGAFHIRDQLNQATIVFYEGATGDVCELSSHPILGTGTGSMHFTTKEPASGSLGVQATFGGILDLVAGGRAHMLGVGNIAFDEFGNLTIHEDHFTRKPIGH